MLKAEFKIDHNTMNMILADYVRMLVNGSPFIHFVGKASHYGGPMIEMYDQEAWNAKIVQDKEIEHMISMKMAEEGGVK